MIFYVRGFNASSPEEAKEEIANGLKRANPFSEEFAGAADGEEQESAQKLSLASSDSPKRNAEGPRLVAAETLKPRLRAVELNQPTSSVPDRTATSEGPGIAESDFVSPDIKKPVVNWTVESDSPSPLARSGDDTPELPKLRETAAISLEDELRLPTIDSADMSAVRKEREQTPDDLPGEEATPTTRVAVTQTQRPEPKKENRGGLFQRLRSGGNNTLFGRKKTGNGGLARQNP